MARLYIRWIVAMNGAMYASQVYLGALIWMSWADTSELLIVTLVVSSALGLADGNTVLTMFQSLDRLHPNHLLRVYRRTFHRNVGGNVAYSRRVCQIKQLCCLVSVLAAVLPGISSMAIYHENHSLLWLVFVTINTGIWLGGCLWCFGALGRDIQTHDVDLMVIAAELG